MVSKMLLHRFCLAFLLQVSLCGPAVFAAEPLGTQKPNIVVVLVDDLGIADFCPEKMPRLSAIARRGTTLELYSQQSCMPSRATFLTGNHPAKYQMFQNFPDAHYYAEPLSGITDPTIADTLRSAGYTTYEIGKWHVGKSTEERPSARGFDEYFTRTAINDVSYKSPRYHIPLFDAAARGVLAHAPRPFFLYLSHHAPHTPYKPLDYEEMVGALDDQVADLHADLPPNTAFVFMSDNGATEKGGSNLPFRGWKGDPYNGALRVANFVTGFAPSATGPIWFGDFHETFAELAGARPPVTDGGSFLHDTVRRGTQNDRSYFVPFVKKRRAKGQSVRARLAAVDGWRKYIRITKFTKSGEAKSSREQLYDLRVDQAERKDVSKDPKYQQELQRMRDNFDHWGGDRRMEQLKTIDLEDSGLVAQWQQPENWTTSESQLKSKVWP